MAGYSEKSLKDKLGIKENIRIVFINSPPHYGKLIGPLSKSVIVSSSLRGEFDFIHYFAQDRKKLSAEFPKLKKSLAQTGILWISWPKKTSLIETDLNENLIREIGLSNGLVDVKVCAVDEQWSGLKFVYRLKDRK